MRWAACGKEVSMLWEDFQGGEMGDAYPVQVLVRKPVLGEHPAALLVLDEQVQRPLQRARKALGVVLLVCLGDPARRALRRILVLCRLRRRRRNTALLLRAGRLRIFQQPIYLPLHIALLCADEHFVVPRLLAVALVPPDIARGGEALRHLALPLAVRGRARLEVEVPCEGQREAFVEALLVQEEGGLEGVQVARDLRRAGEQDAGVNGVGGRGRGLGDRRDVLVLGQGGVRGGSGGCGGCVRAWCRPARVVVAYRLAWMACEQLNSIAPHRDMWERRERRAYLPARRPAVSGVRRSWCVSALDDPRLSQHACIEES